MSFIAVVLIVLILLGIASQFFVIVPAYRGIIVFDYLKTYLSGKECMRSFGSGVKFIWPWETVVKEGKESEIEIKTLNHSFEINLETKDNEPVKLICNFNTIPHVPALVQLKRFKKEIRISAIIELFKGYLSSIQKDYNDSTDLMSKLQEVKEKMREYIDSVPVVTTDPNNLAIKKDKGIIADYYGVRIPIFTIADPELPKELMEAIVKKRTVQEQNAARDQEIQNVIGRAQKIVTASGNTVTFEEAKKTVMLQDGKRTEAEKVFGLDKATLAAISGFVQAILPKKKEG